MRHVPTWEASGPHFSHLVTTGPLGGLCDGGELGPGEASPAPPRGPVLWGVPS